MVWKYPATEAPRMEAWVALLAPTVILENWCRVRRALGAAGPSPVPQPRPARYRAGPGVQPMTAPVRANATVATAPARSA
jgi:hypothetical protein